MSRLESARLDSARRDSLGRGPVVWWSSRVIDSPPAGADERERVGQVRKLARGCLGRAVSRLVSKEGLACMMAFTTGCANVGCMIRYDAYATMMTGNALKMVLHLAMGRVAGFVYFMVAIAVYGLGVEVYRVLDVLLAGRSTATMFAPIVFVLFVLTDVVGVLTDYGEIRYICLLVRDEWSTDEILQGWKKNGPMLFMTLAYGVVNTLSWDVTRYVTNGITGYFQQMGVSLANNLFIVLAKFRGDKGAAFDTSFLVPLALTLSFLLGAILTGLLFEATQPVRVSGFNETSIAEVSAAVTNRDRKYLLPIDFYFSVLGALLSLLIVLHDTVYAERIARKLGARQELRDALEAEETPELNLDSSTLTRMQPVQRTALGRAISMRVRMAEMELKRRGMGAGRSGEESRADLDESNRGQTFLADD